MKILLLSILLLTSSFAHSASKPASELLKGHDVSGKAVNISAGTKGTVVVFISAVCPCSNSHIPELQSLAKDFPDFHFVGVHSNTDEEKEPTQKYFSAAKLPFPVIQDNGAKIADAFKASKTPHAFVMNTKGEMIYQGGVSSSADFARAEHKFLREALEDITKGVALRKAEGRTLGCVISRSGKNAW